MSQRSHITPMNTLVYASGKPLNPQSLPMHPPQHLMQLLR